MWDRSLPKRATTLSAYTTFLIPVGILVQLPFAEVIGTWGDIANRFLIVAPSVFGTFWIFFLVYLFYNPNIDAYLDKHGGDNYGRPRASDSDT